MAELEVAAGRLTPMGHHCKSAADIRLLVARELASAPLATAVMVADLGKRLELPTSFRPSVGPDPIAPVRPFLLFSRLQAWRGFCQERLRLLVGLFSFGPFRLSFGSRLPRICLARCKSTVSKPSVNLV